MLASSACIFPAKEINDTLLIGNLTTVTQFKTIQDAAEGNLVKLTSFSSSGAATTTWHKVTQQQRANSQSAKTAIRATVLKIKMRNKFATCNKVKQKLIISVLNS
jgi:hypothetical protein